MSLTIYQYPKCGTCRNAMKWLREQGVEANSLPIVEAPPSQEELSELIRKSGLEAKKFFNISGEAYKQMQLKDKLPHMSEAEMTALLASNGKLIKRPIVTDGERVTVGFKEEEFERVWGNKQTV